MRNTVRILCLVALFFALSIAPAATGCAWFQKNGGALVASIGCAVSVATEIAGAVHSGQQGAWFDTATQGFAGASDALKCAGQVAQLVQAEHQCAGADGAACSSMPAEEQQRLDKCMTIAQTVGKLRARRELVTR